MQVPMPSTMKRTAMIQPYRVVMSHAISKAAPLTHFITHDAYAFAADKLCPLASTRTYK